jgi:hypothetical protein
MDTLTDDHRQGLMHAGAGAGLALVQLSVVIPGLLPMIALTLAFAAVLLVPLLALGLVLALLAAPPAALWWAARRLRVRLRRAGPAAKMGGAWDARSH